VYDTIRVTSRSQAIALIADKHGNVEAMPGGVENVDFVKVFQISEDEFLTLCTTVKDVSVLTELYIRWSILKLKDGNKLVLSAFDHVLPVIIDYRSTPQAINTSLAKSCSLDSTAGNKLGQQSLWCGTRRESCCPC
jgi:hypothetical protein